MIIASSGVVCPAATTTGQDATTIPSGGETTI